MGKFLDKLSHAWNAFNEPDQSFRSRFNSFGGSFSTSPSRTRMNFTNERSLIAAMYTRMAIDASSVTMKHVKIDENGRYSETMKSGLNECLTIEANIDQAARQFRMDMVLTMFDKGYIAIVPVETSSDPRGIGPYDIRTLRVGEIVQWYPQHVLVSVYDDRTGRRLEIPVSKRVAAIVENPFYSVMNEPNSTLQRLLHKLSLLDRIDEATGSGKLDMIIQLPYVIKSEARKEQAVERAKDIEVQLKGSTYGIAYTDASEKITQLNRPVENNMLKQIEYLTGLLYGQLGLTEEVFKGTATEEVMLNYFNRTVEPILTAITEAMKRTFLTKTARTQGQSIEVFRDPFKLVSVAHIAEIADKFTRNEIFTANEIRGILGFKPAVDPKADELHNSNMPIAASTPQLAIEAGSNVPEESDDDSDLDELDKILDSAFNGLGLDE